VGSSKSKTATSRALWRAGIFLSYRSPFSSVTCHAAKMREKPMMGDQRPPGTSTAYDKVRRAFGPATASPTVYHLDRVRAVDYLVAALRAKLTWAEAEADIRAYLATHDVQPDFIEK
jgi:hypothetical protein